MTPDWKFYAPCFKCKKRKFFVRKRRIPLPTGTLVATSRELFCTPCTNLLATEIKRGIIK